MRSQKRVVLKFGGSVIHSQRDFKAIRDEIKRFVRDGFQVVAVVSAYFGVTESLLAKAKRNGLSSTSSAYAAFVSSGEFDTALDLTRYLNSTRINASFSIPAEFDFLAIGDRDSASPQSIDANKISAALEANTVIVMPGFSAIDEFGDSILLGRGGSDISAVVVAEALSLNSVRLLKDVDGIYNLDPNEFSDAKRLEYVDYECACEIASVLIQPEAVKFAASKNIQIDIAAMGNSFASSIGPKISMADFRLQVMEHDAQQSDQIFSGGLS